MTNNLVRALVAHCDSVFYGPNGDYAAVLEVIEKLPVRQAMWKPGLSQNSIWQIVDHLIASKDWQISMIETGYQPEMVWGLPSGDEEDWKAIVARLKEAHLRLMQTLEKLTDERLLSIPDAKSSQTLLQLILSSGSAHEAHHSGQLDYLRGMQEGNK